METNFKILTFSEKDLSLPNPFDSNNNEIDLEIKPLIRFSNKKNLIIVQTEVSYFQKENLILNYGVALSFSISKSTSPNDLTKDKDMLNKFLEITIGFTRGAMATYIKSTPLKKIILPFIDSDDLLSKSNFMDLDNK